MDMNDVYEMLEYIIKFRTIRAVIKDRYPDLRVLRFENQEIIEDAELYILHEVAEDQERRILLNLDELLGEGGINPAYGELCEDWFRTRDKYMDICSELPFIRAILEKAWTEEVEYEYSGKFEVEIDEEAFEKVWACGDAIAHVVEEEEKPYGFPCPRCKEYGDPCGCCQECEEAPENCDCETGPEIWDEESAHIAYEICMQDDSECECKHCDCDECEVEEPPREPLLDPNTPIVKVRLWQDDEEDEDGRDTEA